MFERRARLEAVIKQELAQIIEREMNVERGVVVTVSRVVITPDLSTAKVYVSALPDQKTKEVLLNLKRRIGYLQKSINKLINIKRTPKLVILEDKELKHVLRVEELLEKIKKENKAP